MPYIITTRDAIATNQSKHVGEDGRLRYDADGSEVFPGPAGVRPSIPTTRRAVATLEEARSYAAEIQSSSLESNDFNALQAAVHALPDAGGTIGPLPDGTVIEVRVISPDELADLAGIEPSGTTREIIAAYNGSERMIKCIERKFFGGIQQQTYDEWATFTIQDEDEAARIAERMLDGDDPYSFNEPRTGAEPEFYEEFSVIDANELRAQMEAKA